MHYEEHENLCLGTVSHGVCNPHNALPLMYYPLLSTPWNRKGIAKDGNTVGNVLGTSTGLWKGLPRTGRELE
jgi:hypothetical protein